VLPWRTQLLIGLHRYSPGGEYDGNEYGGLPVNCSLFVIMLCTNIFAPEPLADNSAVRTAVSRRRFRLTGPACSDCTRINSSLVSSGEDQRRRWRGRQAPLPHRGTDAGDGGDRAQAGLTGGPTPKAGYGFARQPPSSAVSHGLGRPTCVATKVVVYRRPAESGAVRLACVGPAPQPLPSLEGRPIRRNRIRRVTSKTRLVLHQMQD
jgi:hypothetical protein